MRTHTRRVYLLEDTDDGTKVYITGQRAGGLMATATRTGSTTLRAHEHDVAGIYYYSSYPRQQTCYKLLSGAVLWVIERLYATGIDTTSESRDIEPQRNSSRPKPGIARSAGDARADEADTTCRA